MGSFWFRLVIGHLVGDYLLQTNCMALNKKKQDTEGMQACCIHCLVYSLAVLLAVFPEISNMGSFVDAGLFAIVVFISHFIFDRWNIVDFWLELIGSRSYDKTLEKPVPEMNIKDHYAVAYTALVQTVADNTLHLIGLFVAVKIFM